MSTFHRTAPRLAPHARAVVSGLNRTIGRPRLPAWLTRGALLARPWEATLQRHAAAIAAHVRVPRLVDLHGTGSMALVDALVAQHGWLHYLAFAGSDAALETTLVGLRGRSPYIEVEGRTVEPDTFGRVLARITTPRLLLACAAPFAELEPSEATTLLSGLGSVSNPHDTLLLAFELGDDERACVPYREGEHTTLGLRALARVNDELGADFDLPYWRPEVRWDPNHQRVELVVVARMRQHVFVDALGLPLQFEAGDSIQTATFQKHDAASIERLLAASGLRVLQTFVDERCAIVSACR